MKPFIPPYITYIQHIYSTYIYIHTYINHMHKYIIHTYRKTKDFIYENMLNKHTHQELSICSLRTTYTLYTYRKYDFSFEKLISQPIKNVRLAKPPTPHLSNI